MNMNYLPLFFQKKTLKVLIIGGGNVALRKVNLFLGAGAAITVVAPSILPEILEIPGLTLKLKAVSREDLREGFTFAILASDDPTVQETYAGLCRERGMFVNRVDAPEDSDFVTGSVVDSPPLLAAVTSSGSPTISRLFKQRIQQAIDPALLDLGNLLNEIRPIARDRFPQIERRESFFRQWATEEVIDRIKHEGLQKIRQEMLDCLSSSSD